MRPWWHHWILTIAGGALGIVAVLVWMATFEPHGGVNLSPYLFPLLPRMWDLVFPAVSVPAVIVYATMLVYWPLVGWVLDVIRHALSRLKLTKLF